MIKERVMYSALRTAAEQGDKAENKREIVDDSSPLLSSQTSLYTAT